MLKFIKCIFKKNRVNILLGAGASADVCQSTQDLTNLLITNTKWWEPISPNKLSGNPLDPFTYNGQRNRKTYFAAISKLLTPHFKKNIHKVNFEGLLHFASGLDRYVSEYFFNSGNLNKSEFRIPFIFRKKWKHFNLPFAHAGIAADMASKILDAIAIKYKAIPNLEFCSQVFALKKMNCSFRVLQIYSLNYDCVPESAICNLMTGFDDHKEIYSIFSPETLIDKSNKSRFIQLHGSCKYALAPIDIKDKNMLMFVRYKDEEKAVESRQNSSVGSPWAQDGTTMISPYMITGHRKADAILHEPFLSMWMDFSRSSLTTNRLVIIGYSCGDFHVNSIVKNAVSYWERKKKKMKIVFVTYLDPKLITNNKIEWLHENENPDLDQWKANLMTQLRMLLDFHFEKIAIKFPRKSNGSVPIEILTENLDIAIFLGGTKQFVDNYTQAETFLS